MAAISSAASGNWSAGATWVGGVAPTSADTVTILNTHTVTLDTTGCVCNTLTINSGGTLAVSNSANTDITVEKSILVKSGGTYSGDLSASNTYSHTVNLNNVGGTGSQTDQGLNFEADATISLKGFPRTRRTKSSTTITLGASTSVDVLDATGWQIGDVLVFGRTADYSTTPQEERKTITSITPGAGTTATIGWSGTTTYTHLSGGWIGNFSSNVTIQPQSTSKYGVVYFNTWYAGATTGSYLFDNVLFYSLYNSHYTQGSAFVLYMGGYEFPIPLSLIDCPFLDSKWRVLTTYSGAAAYFTGVIDGCVTHSANTYSNAYSSEIQLEANVSISKLLMLGSNNTRTDSYYRAVAQVSLGSSGSSLIDSALIGSRGTGLQLLAGGGYVSEGCEIASCKYGVTLFKASATADTLSLGDTYANGTAIYSYSRSSNNFELTDSSIQSSGTEIDDLDLSFDHSDVSYINKNAVVTEQEIYRPFCEIKRDNSTTHRSTSSISIKPTKTATDSQRTQEILCANGSSIRVIGYVQADSSFYNSGTWTAPTVTLSGLGAATQTFTATSACNGAWEQFDLSITNSSGNDGNFTLTYTANASAVTTGTVYFDGVPDAPFVTKCRHYGFRFDEAAPYRIVNTLVSANESTAAGYTGVTINNSTKEISFGAGTADTAQKFYDYEQALMCANLSYEVPLVRAGSSYTLTDGWTVIDPYYSGDLTWSGGTVQYNSAGTKADDLDSCIIEYDIAGGTATHTGTLTGTLDLRNLDAAGITVEVPSGTTTTDTNNTGGTIIVSTPQIYQSVTINNVTAGSRVQIYDTTNSVELFNDTSTYTWTDGTPAAGDRDIRLRISYVSGATAKDFIEANIGTCGQTEGTKALTYLVAQTNDTTYNTNAIDGPAIYATSGITFTDSGTDLVNCNIAGGAVTYATMYACFVHWMNTATGIADDIAYIDAPDTANYLLTSMKIRNTSATDLTVTGGWGRDATTGLSKDIIDTAGSTGNIFLAPDHVIPYSVGSGLTAGQAAELTSAASAAATAASQTASLTFTGTSVHADIIKVSGTTIDGAGTEVDPWGPA